MQYLYKIPVYLSQPIQRKQVFQTIISLKKRVEGMLGSLGNCKDTKSCKNYEEGFKV